MALELGVLVFVVVVVGGLGSLGGAMIASLLIGLISSFSVGIDASLATLFGLFGAGEWAESVGGLMTVKISSLAATLPLPADAGGAAGQAFGPEGRTGMIQSTTHARRASARCC